jgi:hypothetical protein
MIFTSTILKSYTKLVTANLRHFPESLRHGVTVVPTIEFVQRFVRIGE